MAFDRRREKSFGEPTRVRTDGTAGSTKDGDLPKKPANTAYERYKQELHAFFNGEKPLPSNLKDMLATRPGAAEHGLVEADAGEARSEGPERVKKPKRDAADRPADKADKKVRRVVNGPTDDVLAIVEQIRRANSPREVTAAVDALRGKGVSLPKGDAEVLSKALSHGSDDVLAEALSGLVELDVAQIKSATLLKTRVRNVMLLAGTNEVKDLAGKMLARLG
jgi:hypothetical protein